MTKQNSEQELLQYGYAPGNYQCYCARCGGDFIGDKRATGCKSCAMQLAYQPDKGKEIDELRAQLEENHARAEEIIKSRDNTIARFHAGIAELLDSMRPAEKPVDAEAWQWVIDRLIDLPTSSLSAYHDSIVGKWIKVLLMQIGDRRQCPSCHKSFVPNDATQDAAIELYRKLKDMS